MKTHLWLGCFLVAITAGLVGCSRQELSYSAWRAPRPVRIEGEDAWINLFPSAYAWLAAGDADVAKGLLLRDGDWVLGKNTSFIYHETDGGTLRLKLESGRTTLAGVTVLVNLGDADGWAWLEKASVAELASLRAVHFSKELSPGKREVLVRLAAANRGVALAFESNDALAAVLPLFRPRQLYLSEEKVSPELVTILKQQTEVETLFIAQEILINLPVLPRLERLIIFAKGTMDSLRPLRQPTLRQLMILGSGMKSVAELRETLPQLEELSLLDCGELTDVAGLTRAANLRTLILSRSGALQAMPALAELKELRWLGLPNKITPAQFGGLLAAHPNLQYLEVIGCDGIVDWKPLAGLKSLTGLVVMGRLPGADVLRGLKALRFVGVGVEKDERAGKSKEAVAELRRALPDAMVVTVAPMCLGSGWLLAVPVAALVGWGARRLRLRNHG